MAILEFKVNFPNSSPGLFLLDSVAKLVTLPLQGSEQDCHWETEGRGGSLPGLSVFSRRFQVFSDRTCSCKKAEAECDTEQPLG